MVMHQKKGKKGNNKHARNRERVFFKKKQLRKKALKILGIETKKEGLVV